MYQKLHGGDPRAARTAALAGNICKYQPRCESTLSILVPAALLTAAICADDSVTPARIAPKFTALLIGVASAASMRLWPAVLYGIAVIVANSVISAC